MKRLGVSLLAGLLLTGTAVNGPGMSVIASAHASQQEDVTAENDKVAHAVAFAEKLTADATAALTDTQANEGERLAAFQLVLAEGMALSYISKIMLGDARKNMTPEQLERYERVFPDYITKQYAEQFADIVGRPLEVIDHREIRKDVIVRTQFLRDDANPITVDWRVRPLKSGDQKIIDIIVSGVSIMLVKRDEFSSYIKANGIDALLTQLESEIHEDEAL